MRLALRCFRLCAVLCATVGFLGLGLWNPGSLYSQQPMIAGHAMVSWSATLADVDEFSSGIATTKARVNLPTGTVTALIDSKAKTITFKLAMTPSKGVRSIEVRAARSQGDFSGPVLFKIFQAGPKPLARQITVAAPTEIYSQLITPITNGEAIVVVTTDAHPEGETAGAILMHKSYPHS